MINMLLLEHVFYINNQSHDLSHTVIIKKITNSKQTKYSHLKNNMKLNNPIVFRYFRASLIGVSSTI
jgi:hypothetical protein